MSESPVGLWDPAQHRPTTLVLLVSVMSYLATSPSIPTVFVLVTL